MEKAYLTLPVFIFSFVIMTLARLAPLLLVLSRQANCSETVKPRCWSASSSSNHLYGIHINLTQLNNDYRGLSRRDRPRDRSPQLLPTIPLDHTLSLRYWLAFRRLFFRTSVAPCLASPGVLQDETYIRFELDATSLPLCSYHAQSQAKRPLHRWCCKGVAVFTFHFSLFTFHNLCQSPRRVIPYFTSQTMYSHSF